jgi:hypothetical protein
MGSNPISSTIDEKGWFDVDLLTALVMLFLGQPAPACNASIFGDEDDEMKGGEAVCLHRDLRPDDIGIAHRDLPCGTRVRLRNPRTGREVVAKVVDHGPYGAKVGKRWVIKRKASDPGIWRGCVDLTSRAARMIGHNGFEPVILTVIQKDAPMVKWQHTTVTRWRRWFDSIWGYHENLDAEGVGRQCAPAQATAGPAGAEWSQPGNN